MLHPFHCSYACYYALIWLLYQQQQLAASITIIIDGATTNEWATRDEYQRLVDGSGGVGGVGGGGLASGPPGGLINGDSLIGAGGGGGSMLPADGEPASGGAARRLLALQSTLSSPTLSSLSSSSSLEQPQQRQQQQQQQLVAEEQRAAIDELESALDRLDLIEQQQQRLKQQQQQQQQESSLVGPNLIQHQPQQQQEQPTVDEGQHSVSGPSLFPLARINSNHLSLPSASAASVSSGVDIKGARTLSDLVPVGDDDLDDPLRRLKQRGSSARKYCGHELMDILDLVCQGRYYHPGLSEPQIVNPVVKTKRFVGQQQPTGVVSRRRKLNSPAMISEDEQSATDLDGGTNNNQYLSSSRNQQQQLQQLELNQYNNLLNQNARNKHSQLWKYRAIRGASKECCERSCYADDLKSYCTPISK